MKVDLVRQRRAGKRQAYVGITLARLTLLLLVSNWALTGGGGGTKEVIRFHRVFGSRVQLFGVVVKPLPESNGNL